LTDYPAFRIEFASELSAVAADETKTTIVQVHASARLQEIPNNQTDTPAVHLWRMTILENHTLMFSVVFQPVEPGNVTFELLLSMMSVTQS
jgi:hypothetical protein